MKQQDTRPHRIPDIDIIDLDSSENALGEAFDENIDEHIDENIDMNIDEAFDE